MDTLSNLLTSIRNAEMAQHASTTVPYSTLSEALVKILADNKYIQSFTLIESKPQNKLEIALKPANPPHSFRRISKPGRRVYTNAKSIPTVIQGLGMVIISTPEGVMGGKEAKKRKLGGEILCEVY